MRKTTAEKAATRTAIADRRRKVAAMALARVPQIEIARALATSEGTISTDLKALRAEWAAERATDVAALQALELAALNADEAAWRQKLAKATETDQQLRIYDRIGRIREARCKLLGLDAPIKQELMGKDGTALLIQVLYADVDDHAAPPA